MSCCTPKLTVVPVGSWFCKDCAGIEGGGAGSSSSSGALSMTNKRSRGVDVEVLNTYFVHSKKTPLPSGLPPPPPTLPTKEVALAGAGDPTQLPWLSAAAAADHLQLTLAYLPVLLGLGRPCAVTLSSSGDSLPASWHLATSFAAARKMTTMVVDLSLPPPVSPRGGSKPATAQAAPTAKNQGGGYPIRGGRVRQRVGVGEGDSSGLGALVLVNAGQASIDSWVSLPDAELLVIPLNCPQDILYLPEDVMKSRAVVSVLFPSKSVVGAHA